MSTAPVAHDGDTTSGARIVASPSSFPHLFSEVP